MSKLPLLEYGQYYHVYNRGNGGENIFREERNYAHFLNLYTQHVEPVAETFAYCFLRNHFHLLVRIGEKRPDRFHEFALPRDAAGPLNPSDHKIPSPETCQVLNPKTCQPWDLPSGSVLVPHQQFSNLFNAYAKSFNKTYGRTGSLFQRPFGRIPVTTPGYFLRLVYYIHFNPQKHGFVKDWREYPYSSYHALLSLKPTLLQREAVMEWFNGRDEFEAFHCGMTDEKMLEQIVSEDLD
jgi:REP-associated tyrosine transposase